MDYCKFRFRTVVDWLELEVSTMNRHPAWRVRKSSAGAISFATGLDPMTGQDIVQSGTQGKNTPTTRFAIRIQSPERFAAVAAALASIKDLDPLATITGRGIEISFDAYAKPEQDITRDQLAEMAETMLRGINRPDCTNDTPRCYTRRGTPELRYGRQAVKLSILQGETTMFGNRDDDFIVRGYLKDYDTFCTDNGKPKRQELLNQQDHRARVEVRLQSTACPVKTLDDLKSFRFETLADPFFKFREPDSDIAVVDSLVVNKQGSIGCVIDQTGQLREAHARRGRVRRTTPNTVASPLNEIARDQLRKLTGRWINTGRKTKAKSHNFDEDSGAYPTSDCAGDGTLPVRKINQKSQSNKGSQCVSNVDNLNSHHTEQSRVLNTSHRVIPDRQDSLLTEGEIAMIEELDKQEQEQRTRNCKDYPAGSASLNSTEETVCTQQT